MLFLETQAKVFGKDSLPVRGGRALYYQAMKPTRQNAHAHEGILRIGFVSDTTQANRYRRSGVLRFAAEYPNVHVVFLDATSDNFMRHLGQTAKDLKLDGLITLDPVHYTVDWTWPRSRPWICLDALSGKSRATAFVNLDDHALVHAVQQLLVSRNHIHFAYVGTDIEVEQSRSALRGKIFAQSLHERGLNCEIYQSPVQSSSAATGDLEDLAQWLQGLPRPCAILAYADNRAHAVLDACHLAHLDVPGQISLVGIDNEVGICECIRPTLTSVWPDFEHGGFLAAETLYRLLTEGRPTRGQHILTYGVKSIVERASTLDLRGGGRLVARASELLRQHFRTPDLRIVELARKIHVSRRLLDLRFTQILGRTVSQEIARLRLNDVKRLLRETDLPISDIAAHCGYANDATLRLAFRKATGQSLSEWRRDIKGARHNSRRY